MDDDKSEIEQRQHRRKYRGHVDQGKTEGNWLVGQMIDGFVEYRLIDRMVNDNCLKEITKQLGG